MATKKGRASPKQGGKSAPIDRLAWLLPVTYAAHVAEEYLGGFPRWFNRVIGGHLTTERFFELNGLFWVVMAVGVVVGTAIRPARIVLVTLATIVITNGILHAGAVIVTGSYSPGVVTGVLLWIPLGTLVLGRLQRDVAQPVMVAGMALGVLLHGFVTLAAMRPRI